MAKLQKAADAPAVELPRGKNGKGKGGKKPRVDAKALQAWQSFAKELFPTLAGQPIAVVGDGFLLEPPALLPAAKLHVLRAGVPAGRAAKGRFEPAHALFMAYGAQCTNCEELTLADPRTAAWLRGEEIEAQTAQNGCCAGGWLPPRRGQGQRGPHQKPLPQSPAQPEMTVKIVQT